MKTLFAQFEREIGTRVDGKIISKNILTSMLKFGWRSVKG